MNFEIYELKKRIAYYQSGVCGKKELGIWAEEAYYDLMKGGFLETKKLVLLPFLKVVSKIHIKDNERLDEYASTEEDIEFIRKIIDGEESYRFAVELGVSRELYDIFSGNKNFDKERYDIYHALIMELKETDCKEEKIREIMEQIVNLERTSDLIFDYLEQKILDILYILVKDSDHSCLRREYNFYAKNAERNPLYGQLERYVRCRTGDCNFTFAVCFENGNPAVSYYL